MSYEYNEPLKVAEDGCLVGEDGIFWAAYTGRNCLRVVAAINACAGLSDDQLAGIGLGGVAKLIEDFERAKQRLGETLIELAKQSQSPRPIRTLNDWRREMEMMEEEMLKRRNDAEEKPEKPSAENPPLPVLSPEIAAKWRIQEPTEERPNPRLPKKGERYLYDKTGSQVAYIDHNREYDPPRWILEPIPAGPILSAEQAAEWEWTGEDARPLNYGETGVGMGGAFMWHWIREDATLSSYWPLRRKAQPVEEKAETPATEEAEREDPEDGSPNSVYLEAILDGIEDIENALQIIADDLPSAEERERLALLQAAATIQSQWMAPSRSDAEQATERAEAILAEIKCREGGRA